MRIVYIFQAVFFHALAQKEEARRARRRFQEAHLSFAAEAHDVHVAALEERDVAQNFDDIFFGMDTGARVP